MESSPAVTHIRMYVCLEFFYNFFFYMLFVILKVLDL
jgi:hypothetical protein